jgi:uncharacterized membrane protein
MLAKSRKSAGVMASIALLTTAIVYALAQAQLLSPSILVSLFSTGLFSTEELLLAAGIILLVLVLGVGIAAFIVYRLDDSHYGFRGAILWVVFGIICGLLLSLRSWLLPLSLALGYVAFDVVYRFLRELFGFAVLLFSYWLVFKLLAQLLGWDARKA